MTDFAEEIFSLLGNPNDAFRLSSLIDSFELMESKDEIPEIIVKVKKNTPPSDIRWIEDILSDYDMFYKFTIVD